MNLTEELRLEQKDRLKEKYEEQKKLLDSLRSNATIEKWKILSEAYRLGKKIWGRNFTKHRLAYDMDIPFTTTLRCLSLDKANPRTWKLIREGKITAFKVAQICQSKSVTFQDEIIDLVINDNLSTYQIKTIKVNNLKDINNERHRLAVEKGYSRRDSAYANFQNWIIRGKMFLLLNKKHLPDDKINDLNKQLKDLKKSMNNYIKVLEDKE